MFGVDAVSAGTLWSYEGLKDGGDQLLAAGALPDSGNFALLTTLGELHLVGARKGSASPSRRTATR